MTELNYLENFLIWRYSQKGLWISPKSDTLIFFSKPALTISLVFGLKLVLSMTFNLNETYFSEKFTIWRYLTSKLSKNCPNWLFGHFQWAWCLVIFLQFAGPVNVFLFLSIFTLIDGSRLAKMFGNTWAHYSDKWAISILRNYIQHQVLHCQSNDWFLYGI